MIEVELPDGSIAEFPDGTSNEAIKRALSSYRAAPAQEQPVQEEGRGFFRRVDDAVRGVADMATFGFADEISARLGAMTGIGGQQGDYNANLQDQRARDSQGGYERLGGQVAGAFANPAMVARTLGGAVLQGGALGGAYGFGSGEGGLEERRNSALLGAALGGAAGGTVHKIADALIGRAAQASIPDNAALRATSQAGYDAAENAGVVVRPEGMQRLATQAVGDLADFGYHPALQPRIGTVLSEMERLANTNTTYKGLDTLRKMVSRVGESLDPAEKAMGARIMSRLDDYMANLPAEDVITGNASQAAAGVRQGRDNWARMRRSEMVDTARIKAERRAASTGTGGNLENTIRQNVRGILDNPKRSRGMTQAEKDMAEKVVRGTRTQDALRLVGRLSPTTGGLSAMMNVGATAVNPLLAIPGAVGMASKAAAERMTTRNADRLAELIRSGGYTADDLANQAASGAGPKELRDAILRIRQAESVFAPAASRSAAGLMNYGAF